MRWKATALALVIVLSAALPAWSAERTLESAIQLVVQEVTNLEEDIGAQILRGTPQAKQLRRGKKSFQQAAKQHVGGKWKASAVSLLKGMRKLLKAFEGEDGTPGREALIGVLEELDQLVTAESDPLEDRLDALPATQARDRARGLLGQAAALQRTYGEAPLSIDGAAFIIGAYHAIGRVRKKTKKLEKRVKDGLDNLSNDIPANLPKARYTVAFTVNGSQPTPLVTTPRISGKQLRKFLIQVIKPTAKQYEQAGCTTSTFATPFNQTFFTVGINISCPSGDGGQEVAQLRYTVTRVN